MNLVILPGNSLNNKEWATLVSKSFISDFNYIYKQSYDHWKSGEEFINLDKEIEKLIENIPEPPFFVLAKSAGSILTVKAIIEGKLKPEKCVFLGFPLNWVRENNFPLDYWLEDYSVPTLIIQKTNDPVTSYKELVNSKIIQKKENIKTLEIPGADHKYNNFGLIKEKMG
ncbi:MAG: alpha/beta family hydrolase [Patescibacteria group bacterium]